MYCQSVSQSNFNVPCKKCSQLHHREMSYLWSMITASTLCIFKAIACPTIRHVHGSGYIQVLPKTFILPHQSRNPQSKQKSWFWDSFYTQNLEANRISHTNTAQDCDSSHWSYYIASFLGPSHLQFLIARSMQSKTGAGKGLGTRLGRTIP